METGFHDKKHIKQSSAKRRIGEDTFSVTSVINMRNNMGPKQCPAERLTRQVLPRARDTQRLCVRLDRNDLINPIDHLLVKVIVLEFN